MSHEEDHEDSFDEGVVLLADRVTTKTAQVYKLPSKLSPSPMLKSSPLLKRRVLAPLCINTPAINLQDLSPSSPSSGSDQSFDTASETSRDGTVTPLTPASPTEGTSYFPTGLQSPDTEATPRPLRKKTSKLNVKLTRAAFFSGARSPTLLEEGFELRLERAEKEFAEETGRLADMLKVVQGKVVQERAVPIRITRIRT